MTTLTACLRHSRLSRSGRFLARLGKPATTLGSAILLVALWTYAQSPGTLQSGTSAASQSATASKSAAPRNDPRGAEQAYQEGRGAEESNDWETAYAAYSEAAGDAPANQTYAGAREHARFHLVQSLADLAERQFIAGDVAVARQELLRALQIDPSYSIAQERLADLPDGTGGVTREESSRLVSPPHVTASPGTRNFNLQGTTRSVYEEIGRQFGVTVIFDTDLVDRAIHFQVPQLDYETALKVVERETHTFTRPVNAHTIFVADDTVQKRRDYEPEVERALYLPASETPDEMNETVRTIREMTGIARTQLDAATHMLTVRSSEQNVALAQALLQQIELPRGEMMLEVELLEVDRNAAHQLGITPPTSAQAFTLSTSELQQLQQAQNNGTLVQVLQSIFGAGGALAATGVNPLAPAIVAFGGGKTVYFATVPGASANFAETLNAIHTADRVLLRAQDGKPATFFVGERYPVSLGVLSSNLSTSAAAFASGALAGSFPRTDYATANGPVSVAIADVNGDGIPDLVVADQAANSISILLGNGDGSFLAASNITVGTAPSAVLVGDFNNNGIEDIAVANSGDNTVSILPGNGNGTFGTAKTYATGQKPVALAAQDLNGNGLLDLVVVNQNSATVSVFLNQINGTFATRTDYPVGLNPTAVAIGNFLPSNSIPGLAVTNGGANTVSILLGNGNGTFAAKTDYPTGANPAGAAIADFNGDGNPDLAITNLNDSTFSILLGNGNGTFQAQTTVSTPAGPAGIIAADVTGAGTQDLVISDQNADEVSVFLGNGNGTFNTTPLNLPTGNIPVALAVANLTSSGEEGVVTANEGSNTVSVTLNTLSSGAAAATSPAFSSTAYPAAQYIDLGLKVKATPRVHDDNEVSLDLEFDITSLAGNSINGIPIITNRTIDQSVRLRQDQTSVLSGILQSNESNSISGWPGVSTLPGIGLLTGEQNYSKQDTELLILITPRALRIPPRNAPALYAGPGEPATVPAEAPQGPPGANFPPGAPPPGARPRFPGVPPAPGEPAAPGTPPVVTPQSVPEAPPPQSRTD